MVPDDATVLARAGSCLFAAFQKLIDAAIHAAVCTARSLELKLSANLEHIAFSLDTGVVTSRW